MGRLNSNSQVLVTKLQQIEMEKGAVYHGLKGSEESYSGFGEVYFSFIKKGEVKGWKKHTCMVMNIVVPIGKVRFYICCDLNEQKEVYEIGADNYYRLTIRPGQWVAFEGISSVQSLVVNIANIEHDPDEALIASLEEYPLD